MYLTEWYYYPDNFESMPDPIKLYHGTDIEALDNILTEGVICAKRGRSTGETRGVNWFFVKNLNNFSRGSMFSIEVPKSMFENGQFRFMNDSSVTSRDDEIPIKGLNFKIEKIGGADEEVFMNIYNMMKNRNPNGDLTDWWVMVCKLNREFQAGDYFIDSPVTVQLIKQLFGEKTVMEYGLNESVGYDMYMDEVDADDLNLDSFKVRDGLQPDIWINGKINSEVRKRLLEIAHDFYDSLEIKWSRPLDVLITGSLANYNWSEYSDIDLHLVLNFSEVYDDTELLEDYFKAKKDLWNNDHENLKIYGFPVEVYMEDTADPPKSAGKFSLFKNEWIEEPKDLSDAKLNEDFIKSEAAKIMTKIDDLRESEENPRSIYNKCDRLFEYMKDIRKKGLETEAAEMSSGNIIWKVLRREGYIDKLVDIMVDAYDSGKSIQ